MKKMKRYAASVLSLFLGGALTCFGQDLNRSVEVSNDFSVKMGAVSKQTEPMPVPDSLYRFDLKHSYDVFSSPYMTNYSFKPYLVRIRPDSTAYDGSSFYALVGCGWPLMPDVYATYAPRPKGRFSFALYQDFQAYFGRYSTFGPGTWTGHEVLEKFGGAAQLRLDRSTLGLKASLEADSALGSDLCRSGWLDFKAGSSLEGKMSGGLLYNVSIDYEHGSESCPGQEIRENRFLTQGTVVPSLGLENIGLGADFILGCVSYTYDSKLHLALSPYADFSLLGGKMDFRAGLSVSMTDKFYLSPVIRMDWWLRDHRYDLYLRVDGFNEFADYASLKADNRFLTGFWAPGCDFLNSRRGTDARLGFAGSFGRFAQFDLSAGGATRAGAPVYGWVAGPRLMFCDYRVFSAKGSLALHFGALQIEDEFLYQSSDIALKGAVALPAFTNSASVRYTLRRRILFETSLVSMSSRDVIGVGKMPAGHDLRFRVNYKVNRRLDVWAKGINMLDSYVEQAPFAREDGFDLTAGVTLVL